jgi:hypothetical protein
VAAVDGSHPAKWRAWGWRERTYGETVEYQPQGEGVGWTDGEAVYLQADAAYAVAQSTAQRQGEPLGVSPGTLWKRLRERGLLLSVDAHGEHHTVRHVLAGVRRRVLHLHIESLIHGAPGQPGHPGHSPDFAGDSGVEPDGDGPVPWPGYAANGAKTGLFAGPRSGYFTPEPGADGPDGPVGPAVGDRETPPEEHEHDGRCIDCGEPTAGPLYARCTDCLARVARVTAIGGN